MSTPINAADVINISINQNRIRVIPTQKLISCNVLNLVNNWTTLRNVQSFQIYHIDDGSACAMYTFELVQQMFKIKNEQLPKELHQFFYPVTTPLATKYDDLQKENQIMTTNQLISIQQQTIGDDTVNAVSARELHEFLQVSKKYTDWFKYQIDSLQLVENIDYICLSQKRETQRENGQKGSVVETTHYVTMEIAKHISMASRCSRGREVRDYFIECEKKAQNPQIEQKPEPVKTIRHTNASAMRAADRMIEKMTISDDRKTLARAYLLHKEYDIPVETMLPAVAHKLNATEIGKQLGISANMVGRITNELGIKNDSALCELRLDKSPHSSKQIETCYYAPSVIDMVKAKLNERKVS